MPESPWNRYGTRVTVTTVSLVVLVSVLLGTILSISSVRALRDTMRQTGTAFVLLLATELEQKSKISERLLSRDRRPPPWLMAFPGLDVPPPVDDGPGDRERPGMAPPPRDTGPPSGPPFLAQDLLQIANLIGASRIAILEDDDVFIDVATGGESAEAFDKETALVLLNRLKANPDEHVLQERTGNTLSIITTFVPAQPQKEGALIVQFPFRTARAVVLPQILHLTTSTLIVLLLAVWIALRMSRSVSRPLSDLVDVASTYATGDLTKRAEEEGPVEVATLGRAFNRMAASIEDQIEKLKTETARREQLEGELRIAAELQQSLLPEAARTTYGPVEIVGTCEAAREVGGDFYDFWPVGENRLALVIGDATGKGLPAALLAAKCLSIIQAMAVSGAEPSEVLSRANNLLSRQFKQDGFFVTALLLIIDVGKGEIAYSAAGHNPGFAKRKGDGALELLGSRLGLPLGIDPNVEFETRHVDVQSDLRVLLYTDGVTETFNGSHACYGQQRLEQLFRDHADDNPGGFLDTVKAQLHEFSGGCPMDDDRTLVVLTFNGTNE
ncbi:MAG: hypothetical protein AMXMBFR82_51340 [Candidatus Hydrogenedentota bacterium]